MLAKNAFTCTRCDPCIPCVRIGFSIYFCTAWRVRRAYARANCARQTTVQSIIRHLSGRLPSIGVTKGHWKVLSPPQKHFWGGETIKCSEKNLRWLLCNGHYIYMCWKHNNFFSTVYLSSNLCDNAMHLAGQWIFVLFH